MKRQRLMITALGCMALLGALFFPRESAGQADLEDVQVRQLITEITAQAKLAVENQTKIDTQIAAITEEVRLARIYASRVGKAAAKP